MKNRILAQFKAGTDMNSFMEKEYNDLVMTVKSLANRSTSEGISKVDLPITSIQSSSCSTLDQWHQVANGEWVLPDGRDVTGSAYHKITGSTTVPNILGRVMRCKSYASGVNPDGDTAVGTRQADMVGPLSLPIGNDSTNGGIPLYGNGVFSYYNLGGVETRMKNTTVNFFVRIN